MSKDKIATGISLILSAPIYAFFLLVIIVCNEQSAFVNRIIDLIVGTLFLSVFPILPILYSAYKGQTDIFVQEQEKRPRFFTAAIVCYLIGFIIFRTLKNQILAAFLLCYATVTAAIMMTTMITKVSVHTAGVAGPTTFMVMIFGVQYCLLYLLLLPVGWARRYLKAHNISQLILGIMVSVIVTYFTIVFSQFLGLL